MMAEFWSGEDDLRASGATRRSPRASVRRFDSGNVLVTYPCP